MKSYYSWRNIGTWGVWKNHLRPKDNTFAHEFTSLCGQHFGALNASNPDDPYCKECKRLRPGAEEARRKEEEAQRARVVASEAKREPKRKILASKLAKEVKDLSFEKLNELKGWLAESQDE